MKAFKMDKAIKCLEGVAVLGGRMYSETIGMEECLNTMTNCMAIIPELSHLATRISRMHMIFLFKAGRDIADGAYDSTRRVAEYKLEFRCIEAIYEAEKELPPGERYIADNVFRETQAHYIGWMNEYDK